MTKIEKLRGFLSQCPYLDDFSGGHIDWTDAQNENYGIVPTGEAVIERFIDVLGRVTLCKKYSAVLFARRFTVNDVLRLENAGFFENIIEWIDEQSARGRTPAFGDVPDEETISADNGMVFEMDEDAKTGLYQLQIQITYTKCYERQEQ